MDYTTRMIAKRLGISRQRVWDYFKKGKIKYYRLEGRCWVKPADLEYFIEHVWHKTPLGRPRKYPEREKRAKRGRPRKDETKN